MKHIYTKKSCHTSFSFIHKPWQQCLLLLVVFLSFGVGNVWGADPSETVTISDIAEANSWSNGQHYSGWTSSSGKFTFTASDSGQGLYYSSDNSWRGYNSKGAMVITAGSGITIKSVTSSPSKTWSVATGGGSASFTPTATTKFTSFTITYTEAISCGVPTDPTNGSVSASGQPVSWTAPGTTPGSGYLVAYSGSSTAPGDNVKVNSAQTWGDFYVIPVTSGTTFTFNESTYNYSGTTYYWWVRSKCSSSDYSDWVAGTSFTIPSSCSNTVTPAAGTKENVSTIAFDEASVETCSETASDRQVTVTITPASCYTVPSSTRLTVTGATYVSGPTDNGDGTYSFVYEFAQNATGTKTFAASLSTKATYTVSYAAGTVPSGGGSITGSHANDTKTCGESMTLPAASFTTTGYTQTGWSKTNGGSQYAAVEGSYTDNAAQTFYPVWTANSYNVTWKVNNTNYSAGGSTSVSYGSHISTLPTAPSTATYCGDLFVGWTDATDGAYVHGTSNLYTEASQFPNATGAQTFYAVFADYITE